MADDLTTYPTILEKFYEFEKTRPGSLFLSEPVNRIAQTFTWKQAGDEIRRIVSSLQSMSLPEQSKIAILGKNSAHWILADLAIMMAGFVSVPLYPTLSTETLAAILEHSECKVIFIGKLDNYDDLAPGIPSSIKKISFPFYPKKDCLDWGRIN